jgi:hypothetical protein
MMKRSLMTTALMTTAMTATLAATALLGLSCSAFAQQGSTHNGGTYKVKSSAPPKAAKSTPIAPAGKNAGPTATNAKSLQSIEHQTNKSTGPAHSPAAGKKAGAGTIKPVKDKPNTPMNFNGSGSGKSAGMTSQAANPYKGRLKQKTYSQK